jgi:hypothetical protein
MCAKAPLPHAFQLGKSEASTKKNREGAQAILNTHPQHWSRAWFRLGSNCDSVDNNICESFNKWIIEARFFPIIIVLKTIRRKVMVRIQEQRTKSEKWTSIICPNINKKIKCLYFCLHTAMPSAMGKTNMKLSITTIGS